MIQSRRSERADTTASAPVSPQAIFGLRSSGVKLKAMSRSTGTSTEAVKTPNHVTNREQPKASHSREKDKLPGSRYGLFCFSVLPQRALAQYRPGSLSAKDKLSDAPRQSGPFAARFSPLVAYIAPRSYCGVAVARVSMR